MQEMQVWSLGHEDPLEKGMATHSNILAWRIPWTEEPEGYSPWDPMVITSNFTKSSWEYGDIIWENNYFFYWCTFLKNNLSFEENDLGPKKVIATSV